MCYEDSDFIGLKALISATNELVKKYKIIIVFDASIRSILRCEDDEIRAQFDPKINVHVAAAKQNADETLIDIASDDNEYFIISNDRFGEYLEKEPVQNNRLTRHSLVDGKVIISDLGLSLNYS